MEQEKHNTIKYLTSNQVEKTIEKLRNAKPNNMCSVILPVSITLDLSGSMHDYIEDEKFAFEIICEELKKIEHHNVFLIVTAIYYDAPRIIYCGFAEDLNPKDITNNIFEGYGPSAIASTYMELRNLLLGFVEDMVESHHNFINPVIMFLSDFVDNSPIKEFSKNGNDLNDYAKLINEDIEANNYIVFKFSPKFDKERIKTFEGERLNIGKYNCSFEGKKIIQMINTLSIASSTVILGEELNKSNKKEYAIAFARGIKAKLDKSNLGDSFN